MLSRNFCEKSVRENFGNFHTVHTLCDGKFVNHFTLSYIYQRKKTAENSSNQFERNFALFFTEKKLQPNFTFDIKFVRSKLTRSCKVTVWKLHKFTLTHVWQKFRESNGFTK